MDTAARSAGSVISSVLFGALAGSKALPFERAIFEKTIADSGRAVPANLRGFALGYDKAQENGADTPTEIESKNATNIAPAIAPLISRMKADFPPHAHYMITEGLKKLVDYMDVKYAHLYLGRLSEFAKLDSAKKDWRLTNDMARYLALAMSYDDIIRVADLKTRSSRFANFRVEVKADTDQIVHVSEYMHPRLEEICDIFPARLGRTVQKMTFLNVFFGKGRRISTTKLRGFLLLNFLGNRKNIRRKSLRYHIETERIIAWMDTVKSVAVTDYNLACELASLQRLVKGYGDTHARGLANIKMIMGAYDGFKARKNAAADLKALKIAALKDEEGTALSKALQALHPQAHAAE